MPNKSLSGLRGSFRKKEPALASLSDSSLLNSSWVIGFIILSLIRPTGFGEISWLTTVDAVLAVGQVIAFVAAVWMFRDRVIRRFLGVFAAIVLIQLLCTIINGEGAASFSVGFFSYCKILVFILLIESFIGTPYFNRFLSVSAWVCMGVLVVNLLVTFTLNPQGIYSGFAQDLVGTCFYGDKNALRNPVLFGFAASALLDIREGKTLSLRTLAVGAIGMMSVLLVWSATSIICVALAFLLYTFILMGGKLPSVGMGILVVALCWVLVIFSENLGFIRGFIENGLNRTMEFSGRKGIWQTALALIAASPILGAGFNGAILAGWGYVSHAHDAYLDIAYKGGLIALLLFIAIIAMSCVALNRRKDTKESQLLCVVLVAFLLAGIFGSLDNMFFYGLLCLAFNVDRIIEQNKPVGNLASASPVALQNSRLSIAKRKY